MPLTPLEHYISTNMERLLITVSHTISAPTIRLLQVASIAPGQEYFVLKLFFLKGEHNLLASKYSLEKRFMLYKILLEFLSNVILRKMLCSVNKEKTPFVGLTEQKKHPKYILPAGAKEVDTGHKLLNKS